MTAENIASIGALLTSARHVVHPFVEATGDSTTTADTSTVESTPTTSTREDASGTCTAETPADVITTES